MKILLLTPKYFPNLCGNTITVDRIKKKLEKKGIEIEVVIGKDVTKEIIRKVKPTIVHAFHARKSNIEKIRLYLSKRSIPYVLTLTGTDVNYDIFDHKKKLIIKKVIENAAEVTAFQKEILQKIKKENISTKKQKVIPQGAPIFDKTNFKFRKNFKIKKTDYAILLVAGIRDIKDPFYAIEEVCSIAEKNKNVKLIILGEILDKQYHKKLKKHCKENNCTFITQGRIPHNAMASAYKESDLVINTSDAESMSTALVEAQYFGKQILAADIPGNAFFPKNCLYAKKKGALAKAIKKLMNRKQPNKGRKKSKDNEAEQYIKLYEKLL
jgi:glycosyltransferase involved in cell wall biosynthesis